MSLFQRVEDFNRQVVGIREKDDYDLPYEQFDWLKKVCHEEITEFHDAYNQGDVVGQVDALIDLIYFAAGGLTRLGVSAKQSEAIFAYVHDHNMRKAPGNKGRGSDLDAIKPAGWQGPESAIKVILYGGME